jgi:hypothetical protein
LWRRPRPKLGCGAKERRESNKSESQLEGIKRKLNSDNA